MFFFKKPSAVDGNLELVEHLFVVIAIAVALAVSVARLMLLIIVLKSAGELFLSCDNRYYGVVKSSCFHLTAILLLTWRHLTVDCWHRKIESKI
jgi:hypothetical protein